MWKGNRDDGSQTGIQRWSRDCAADLSRTFGQLAFWMGKQSRLAAEAGTENVVADSPSTEPPEAPLNLDALNPSLFMIGLDTAEALMPRYLGKAGYACECMQHAAMPVELIRKVLHAIWGRRPAGCVQDEEKIRDVFRTFDAGADGILDEDDFVAVLPLVGEAVPPEALPRLFEAIDDDASRTIDGAEFVQFIRKANPLDKDAVDGWRAFLCVCIPPASMN